MAVIPDGTDRMKTTSATLALVERVHAGDAGELVPLLATAAIDTSETSMGECLAKAAELEGNLDTAGWDIFEAVGRLTDERKPAVDEILAEVRQALSVDEHVCQLAPALKGAQAKAVRLLTKPAEPSTPPPPVPKPPIQKPGKQVVGQGSEQDLTLPGARDLLSRLDREAKPGQAIRVNVGWIIEEGGSES